MKKIILITLFFSVTNLFAQEPPDSVLVKEIPTIKSDILQQRVEIDALTQRMKSQGYVVGKQNRIIDTLQNKNKDLNASIDSLSQLIQTNSQNIVTNSTDFGTKIKRTVSTVRSNNSQITKLKSSLSNNQLYWIIATLIILLLGVLLYWLLGKRIQSSKTDVESQIKNTKTAIEEESVKLDNKLLQVLETQLKLKQEESKAQPIISNEKIDHSLALKVADEMVRMQKNISRMDEDTKGLKPLQKGIERIQSNFAANGYEMTNLLNKRFDDRMTIDVVNVLDDENLQPGEKIITKIIRPQVLYNEIIIQRAQVEVSQN